MKFSFSLSFFILILLFSIHSCQTENVASETKIPGAFKAMQMLSHARAYPNDDIPENGFGKAVDHCKASFNSEDRSPVDPWESMGPINTAGRTLALALNPEADSTVYLGSASGGLWRSRSLGLGITWEYMPIAEGVLGVSSIAFATGDSTQMYVGTGEVYNNEITGNDGAYRATRGSYGVGIFKSIDGGSTWDHSLDFTYQNKKGIQVVKVDPNNDQIVYAGVTDGVVKSVDAGSTWDYVLNVPMVTDIEINNQNIVIACGNLGSTDKGIYNSTDGGNTWSINTDTVIPLDFQGKILLASYPSNPNIMFASIGNGFSFSDGATWLLRSDDGGINWELKSTIDYSKWQGWFAHDVSVDPFDPDNVSTVGIDIFGSTDGGTDLAQRSNGGVTLGNPLPNEPDGDPFYSHSDHHVTLHHPNIQDLILYGNDGGLFLSFDGGNSFRSANGGLQTTQYYNGFSVSHQNPEFAMGGLQDNSTSIHRGNGLWQRAVGGDGSWTGINFNNDNKVYASYQNLNIAGSNNNGQSFNFLGVPHQGQPIFIAPYQISESDPNIIYAGGQYIYRSEDEGDSWEIRNGVQPLNSNGDPIYVMAIATENSDVVYASTAPYNGKGEIYLSTDGGDNWSNITGNLPDRFINDIYVDPTSESTAYITLSGFGSGHVFKTENYGQSWEDISSNLPDLPTNAILVDPMFPNHLYLGNDLGLFYSLNGGTDWEDFNEGVQGSTIIMDLEYSPIDRKIWAATHGRGVFRRDLILGESSAEDLTLNLEIDLMIYPNLINVGDSFTLNISTKKSETALLQIHTSLGEKVYENQLNLINGVNSFKTETVNYTKGLHYLTLTNTLGESLSKPFLLK